MREHRRARSQHPPAADLLADVREVAKAAGLDALRIADAAPFLATRAHLEQRKAAGLHGGMAFTYRRPERSTDPSLALPGARTLVVGARSYLPPGSGGDPADPEQAGAAQRRGTRYGGAPGGGGDGPPQGRVARSARRDEYALLKSGLAAVGRRLKAAGYRARVLADDNALVDRAAAYRAGIGWWGKNTLIILPGLGSFFVLGSVLTDAVLAPDEGPLADRCGRCFRCAPACPTGAIVAPGVLDARRCLAWLLEAPGPIPRQLREAVGDRIYGCDACQEACPPNRAAALRATRLEIGRGRPARRGVGSERTGGTMAGEREGPVDLIETGDRVETVDLVEMVRASDAELMGRYGHFYLAGRDPALLRRNALVALGNVGRGDDARVAAALQVGLRSPAPIVRAHAVWAAGRLGRTDLLAGAALAHDPDRLVQDELAAPAQPRR
jgi:epoxyqueuosine reductase